MSLSPSLSLALSLDACVSLPSPQSGIKSPSSIASICTGAARNPAAWYPLTGACAKLRRSTSSATSLSTATTRACLPLTPPPPSSSFSLSFQTRSLRGRDSGLRVKGLGLKVFLNQGFPVSSSHAGPPALWRSEENVNEDRGTPDNVRVPGDRTRHNCSSRYPELVTTPMYELSCSYVRSSNPISLRMACRRVLWVVHLWVVHLRGIHEPP